LEFRAISYIWKATAIRMEIDPYCSSATEL